MDTSLPTLVLEGVITNSTIAPLSRYMDDILTEPKATTQAADKPARLPAEINIVISSPGGSVVAGFLFLDRMKAVQARGTVVNCYVADVAASMAFQILLQCDRRYATSTSFLLWHRARVSLGFGGAMTGPEMASLGRQLKDLDEHIYNDVAASLSEDVPDHYIRFHFEKETLHTGANLGTVAPHFITVEAAIPGVYESLTNEKLVRSAKGGMFDMFAVGELIYINPYIDLTH